MKTAHILPNKKTRLIVVSSLLLSGLLYSFTSNIIFAQSATNPFVTTPVVENTLVPEPILYDATDATKTIAQDQISLTAIPPRLGDDNSLTGKPGEKLQVQLRVKNISEQTVPVVTSAQDFILDEDGATPVPINDNVSNRWSLASWLTITPTEHEIPSKSTVGINVLIEIPEDALPGGHYAMILHQPGNSTATEELDSSNESNSAVNQRVGTLLYVIVEGPINEEAYIRDFTFPSFSEYGPVPFEFVVENNSDVHVTPQMSVEIYNIFNQRLETIPVDAKNIFPLTSREFTGSWEKIWGMGLYHAKLTMSFGTQGAIVIANTSFWLLPIKIIVAVATTLLILLMIMFSIKRHLRHRKEMDEKKINELENKIQAMQEQGNSETHTDEPL